jgi:hypothetical protein
MRAAVVNGDAAAIAATLAGGDDPRQRLAIHARHYEASLAAALVGKFPALVWLIGSDFVTAAARAFVRHAPPAAPCIAEYGESFPDFLATRPGAGQLPYLASVGALEWRLAHVALAVGHPPLAVSDLREIEPSALADATLRLQPGVRYLAAPWPVDDLFGLFLSEERPAHYELAPGPVRLEIRGARGRFSMTRLAAGDFAFRNPLAHGEPIGTAAERALDADAAFDPGAALVRLVAEGLAVDLLSPQRSATP